ncbi:hypothetical protein CLF_101692 [Clonorchis sinensis]|uniref:Endonuclease/exonuclease/phosphatase domain-containing protein n=1 Tax=Clonorchis sinensis TaxID=79923 RepID=G7Y6C3_CLOSI|nr:hypothetical protein CLF_101692 [Clonorchis sinensis]
MPSVLASLWETGRVLVWQSEKGHYSHICPYRWQQIALLRRFLDAANVKEKRAAYRFGHTDSSKICSFCAARTRGFSYPTAGWLYITRKWAVHAQSGMVHFGNVTDNRRRMRTAALKTRCTTPAHCSTQYQRCHGTPGGSCSDGLRKQLNRVVDKVQGLEPRRATAVFKQLIVQYQTLLRQCSKSATDSPPSIVSDTAPESRWRSRDTDLGFCVLRDRPTTTSDRWCATDHIRPTVVEVNLARLAVMLVSLVPKAHRCTARRLRKWKPSMCCLIIMQSRDENHTVRLLTSQATIYRKIRNHKSYNIHRSDGRNSGGGGCAIYSKSELHAARIDCCSLEGVPEAIWIPIEQTKPPVLVGFTYLPAPPSPASIAGLSRIISTAHTLPHSSKFVLGDFNLSDISWFPTFGPTRYDSLLAQLSVDGWSQILRSRTRGLQTFNLIFSNERSLCHFVQRSQFSPCISRRDTLLKALGNKIHQAGREYRKSMDFSLILLISKLSIDREYLRVSPECREESTSIEAPSHRGLLNRLFRGRCIPNSHSVTCLRSTDGSFITDPVHIADHLNAYFASFYLPTPQTQYRNPCRTFHISRTE